MQLGSWVGGNESCSLPVRGLVGDFLGSSGTFGKSILGFDDDFGDDNR